MASTHHFPLSRWAVGYVSVGMSLLFASGCGSFRSQGLNAEGTRHYMSGDYEGAAQRFLQAMNSDPGNSDSYYNLAVTYHQLGKRTGQDSQLELAERYYHQCLDRNSEHVECYRALSVMLVETGRSDDALQLLEGWAERSPDSPEPRIELARLSEELGDSDKAKALLENALIVDPHNARALAALGHLYERMGDHRQALLVYERSLAVNRQQPGVAQRVASLRNSFGGDPLPPNSVPERTRIVTGPEPGTLR